MVNNSRYPITQAEEKNKQYTTRDSNRADCARIFQNITGKTVKQIIHAVDKKITQNFPILREYFGMYEYIYGHSVLHLQGKIVCHKVQQVDPILVPNLPKGILDFVQ